MEENTESLIISKCQTGYSIVIQHDQSGSAYGMDVSEEIFNQLRHYFEVANKLQQNAVSHD